MKARPRIALIGAGAMGSLHARVIHQSGVAELSMIVEKNPQTGLLLAEKYDTEWSEELPDTKKFDAVIIATPTEYHHDLACAVIDRGIPLLVEKPVSDSLNRTLDLIERARQSSLPLMCGLLERFNPAVLTALAMIRDPQYLSAVRHSPYAPRIKTGVAWDLLIHDADLACRFFGFEAPTEVNGKLSRFDARSIPGSEDIAEALLVFRENNIGHISASRTSQRKIRTLSVQDGGSLIEADLLRRDVTVYRHVSDQPSDDEGRGYRQQTVIDIPELVTNKEPLVAQLEHFVELLNGQGDAELEYRSLIPAHTIVDTLKNQSESLAR